MAVSLSGNSLPNYSEENVEYFVRGSSFSLANGSIQHDNISSTIKRKWRLLWRALVASNKDSIVTAYGILINGSGSTTFIDINNVSYSVTIPQNRRSLTVTTYNANTLRYDVSIELEEI